MASTEQYLAKNPAVAARALGEETILMSPLDSTLFTLNPVGSVIWEAANGATPLSRIVNDKICAAFAVAPEQALADAAEFVDEMVKHGILLVSDQPIAE